MIQIARQVKCPVCRKTKKWFYEDLVTHIAIMHPDYAIKAVDMVKKEKDDKKTKI